MSDQLWAVMAIGVAVLVIVAYATGYRHGRVDGYRKATGTWFKVDDRIGIKITQPEARPVPAPGSPFGPPPDLPASPEYDQKGIGPGV
jgi:hypothetical protein